MNTNRVDNHSSHSTPMAAMVLSDKISWTVAFVFVAAATIIGNSLTLVVFFKTKLLHRRSSYLIINLTIADGLVGILSIPLFIYILHNGNTVGDILYNIYAFQDIVLGLTSVSTLMFVAAERYYAVRYPLKYRAMTPRAHITMLILSWILAILIATCRILASLGVIQLKAFTYIMVFSIAVPLFLTCTLYKAVWISAKARPRCGRALNKEHKLSLTLLIITGIFIVSWTPFPIANIVFTFSKKLASFSGFTTFAYITKLLHYGNSSTNPLIYTLRIADFRKSLINMLRRGITRNYRTLLRSRRENSRSTITSRVSVSSKKSNRGHDNLER